jgi:carbonic anhydrase/acetyltransferase-like protein (isoleucine patch superfamily)
VAVWQLGESIPVIHPDAFVHPDATLIGAVSVGAESSIWPGAVLRADFGRIIIGERTSIQDGTVLHCVRARPTRVGNGTIVGHLAHLEGCEIGDDCLVGSGSVVLNNATVQDGAAVAAAALVAEGTVVPTGHIAVGVPGRLRGAEWVRDVVRPGAEEYVDMARAYRCGLRRIDR